MAKLTGEHPLAKDERGNLKYHIGTVFLTDNSIIAGKGTHNLQKFMHIGEINDQRKKQGLHELGTREEASLLENTVDLIMQENTVFIRPEPEKMELAFRADELLQEIVPKYKIKFLGVLDSKVRKAVKQRGELWRINALPKTTEEMIKAISNSKVAISDRKMYYYNMRTGTRYLTFDEFSKLGQLSQNEINQFIYEIIHFSRSENKQGNPELDFFMAPQISYKDFIENDFCSAKENFFNAVKPDFRQDDYDNPEWRKAMFSELIKGNEQDFAKTAELSEESLLGLCPEFYMHIEWLPGAKIDERRAVILDSIFGNNDDESRKICNEKAKGFISNFLREYSQVEYINIGKIVESLAKRKKMPGRREVYIAEIKIPEKEKEIVKMIRFQKWDVIVHLEQGKDTPTACREAEDYTEYVHDRHSGCKQLGIKVPPIRTKKINENYKGQSIRSTYFERDYIYGIATDKISSPKYQNKEYSLKLAGLLGKAAALNCIIGRGDNGDVLFDDGDEVVIEDSSGMPIEIMLADLTGSFHNYKTASLENFAKEYAEPVNKRAKHLANAEEFAEIYVKNFAEKFKDVQNEYRVRKKAFDFLFSDRKYDPNGSFAYRWEQVLKRLAMTNADELAEEIRKNLTGGEK